MTTEKKSVISQKERLPLPKFPLEVTPGKLVIPSSGHLDVKIKNPTDADISINFEFNSYSFDVDLVYMEDGKEIIEPFIWGITKEETEMEWSKFNYEDKIKANRHCYTYIKSGNVAHLRITCEGRDEEIKNKLTFDEETREVGYLYIKSSLSVAPKLLKPEDTDYASGFHLESNKYFLLSIDPEYKKAKELEEKFLEHQKQHARQYRVIGCSLKEDKEWMRAPRHSHSRGVVLRGFGRPKKSEKTILMETWNKEILTKYGPKIDQMSDDELKKIKEGYRNAYNMEEQKKEDERAEKERMEKKKKCIVM